jgi:hypothetical protein
MDEKSETNNHVTSNSENENLANTNIESTDNIVTNQNQQTQDMEVHHHSHSHGTRNWKSYFWEFFMLFLAVFCGFLAEYQLEHKLEKDRVKEYAESFINDLAQDTLQFQYTSYAKLFREQKLDTLIQLLSDTVKVLDEPKIYYLSKFLFRDFPYHTQDATFQQVRNSGSLRYIKNKKLLKSLTNYYTNSIWIENDFNYFQTRRTYNFEVLKITSQIFNSSEYYKLMKDTLTTYNLEILVPETKMKFNNADRKLLNQLAALAVLAIEDSRDFRNLGNYILKPQVEDIISQIKKEYKIEH